MKNLSLLIGRIGNENEIHTFENGNAVYEFPLYTEKSWRDNNGQKQKKSIVHTCKYFRKADQMNVVPYLKKGSVVSVQGELDYKEIENSHPRAFINVDEIILLSSSNKEEKLDM